MNIKLRNWQQEALNKAMDWLLVKRTDNRFLINAAPGAGKTLATCVIAQKLLENKEIDRIIVIAPRKEVVNQWAKEFNFITRRHMSQVTAADGDINSLDTDICVTWAAVQNLKPELQAMCQASNVLVVCDEHHHSAVEAVWGKSTNEAFSSARFAILLTGTPIRSDGAESVWLAYDNEGAIDHPEEGTYTLTYGEAVDFNYCRPVTFHRHEGKFSVVLGNNSSIKVSGHKPAVFPRRLKRISQLQNALNFYKLACKPQYQKDLTTPLINGYQGTMLQAGSDELTDLRHRMPNAGGLVIAPTIEMAEYMAKLLELIEGETPILVHSLMPNPDGKIKAFRNTKKRWIVSVAMISEGVDIKRLRVLVYLPTATTELAFRQALGRVVRTAGPEDDTRAYVVMPRFETFERYALRVEDEMPASLRRPQKPPRLKRCGSCGHECPLSAEECPLCGYEFPPRIEHTKLCDECNAINPASAKTCHACGTQFGHDFILTLDDALREGVISRGMDIDEAETQEAERLAPRIRSDVMRSGDQRLVRIIQSLPPESWARLSRICNTQKESK